RHLAVDRRRREPARRVRDRPRLTRAARPARDRRGVRVAPGRGSRAPADVDRPGSALTQTNGRKGNIMVTKDDDDVRRWVVEELYWEPKFDGEAIAVSVDEGRVTLRGTVGSFHEKREAQKSAERVYGVESVKNELTVRLLGKHGRDNAELRADVLQAL